jgi:hypothetical protein
MIRRQAATIFAVTKKAQNKLRAALQLPAHDL